MAKPAISIIIPALNEEKFLPNLLSSIAGQTEQPLEVIVVDGKSRDKTVAAARGFKNKLPSLRVIVADRASLPYQRNLGAKAARGQWNVFVDADTVLQPYCLKRLEAVIASGDMRFITAWGSPDSGTGQDALSTLVYNLLIEAGILLKRPFSPGPFTVIKRDVFMQVGGYDEQLEFGEDQNMTVRLIAMGIQLAVIRETLYIWSMRRFRAQGLFRPLRAYVLSSLTILFTKNNFRSMPGYVMGGHVYQKRKPIRRTVMKDFERKLKKIIGDLF